MKLVRLLLMLCFSLLILPVSTPVYSISDSPDYILLKEGWQYRIGDSPIDSDGLPVWIKDTDPNWNDLLSMSKPLERPFDENTAWFRIRIPDGEWSAPSIYFEELLGQSITIYLGGKELYRKERIKSAEDTNQVLIPFHDDAYNQYLYIRVNSYIYPRFGPAENIYLGDYQDIFHIFYKKGFISEMVGFALVFMGICLFIVSFLVSGKQRNSFMSLASGIISIGLIIATYLTNFTIRYPEFTDIMFRLFDLLITVFFISITIFFEQIFGCGYKKIIRRSWQVMSVLMLFQLFTLFFNPGGAVIYVITYIIGILAIIQFIILISAAVYYSIKGNLDAKIFMTGFSVFALILVVEMMIFLLYSNNYKFFAFKLGIIIFIISELIILGRKVTEYHKQVIAYSKELETKNQQLDLMWNEVKNSRDKLAELNKTLEDRVIERTRQLEDANEELLALNEELSASNNELTNTLEILKNAQEQLIKSEKMAALGQLVSGIAHELNTPLGAIQASINNITEYSEIVFSILPDFLIALTPETTRTFFQLMNDAKNCDSYVSTRDERLYRKTLKSELTSLGIDNPGSISGKFVSMGIYTCKPYNSILTGPENNILIEMAYLLSCIKRSTHTISLAAEKTTKVVFALKSYSHQGTLENAVETDITDSIETVLTIYHNKIKHGVEITRNYSKLPKIKCNPDELTQVWTNIIHNALQAMEYKGVLTIGTSSSEDNIIVTITDSGSGIPENIEDKIFQPFFTTKPLGEGTGLGLDIVTRIIHKHNGNIEVKSKPGKTTFTVYLPK